MNTLRALIRRPNGEGLWEAKLLELDIAVTAKTEEALLSEIAYALTAEYKLAVEKGLAPFNAILNCVPTAYHDNYAAAGIPGIRPLPLPVEVLQALAIATHKARVQPFGIEPFQLAKAA